MSFTLFDLHVQSHEKVGTINFGQTSASTDVNSIEDQTESSAHADDQFSGGTLYFTRAGNTSNTWFQGKFTRILDYDASSGQYTLSSAGLTTLGLPTTGAGNPFSSGYSSYAASTYYIAPQTEYGVATPEFNLSLMNRLANAAVRTLGPLVYMDRSLRSSGTQTVYTLSTVATRGKPFRIDIQGRAGSSADDPSWTQLHGWHIEPSTEGAGQKVVFPRSLPQNRDIRIFYEGDHQELTASTQIIDGRLHPELVTLALVEKMYEYRNSRARGAQDFDVQRWNDAKRQLAEARIRWPVWRPKKKPDITVIGGTAWNYGKVDVPPFGQID